MKNRKDSIIESLKLTTRKPPKDQRNKLNYNKNISRAGKDLALLDYSMSSVELF